MPCFLLSDFIDFLAEALVVALNRINFVLKAGSEVFELAVQVIDADLEHGKDAGLVRRTLRSLFGDLSRSFDLADYSGCLVTLFFLFLQLLSGGGRFRLSHDLVGNDHVLFDLALSLKDRLFQGFDLFARATAIMDSAHIPALLVKCAFLRGRARSHLGPLSVSVTQVSVRNLCFLDRLRHDLTVFLQAGPDLVDMVSIGGSEGHTTGKPFIGLKRAHPLTRLTID